MTKPYGTVLIKASKILDFLSESKNGKTLKYISESVEMTTSTTLKILDTLQLIGYVTRNETDKTYYLGPSLVKYGNKYLEDSTLKNVATPILEILQNTVDETIHLGVKSGNELVYVDKLEPKNQSIYMSSKVGASKPLYSTGMGKTFLSFLEEEQLEQYFEITTLEAYTEKTITNKFQLKKELVEIKANEVAYDDEEMEKDCFCIAMPIVNNHKIEGSFSVSLPKFRASEENKSRIIKEMKETKKIIEEKLRL